MKFLHYLIILPFVIIAILVASDAEICSDIKGVCFQAIKLSDYEGFKLETVLAVFFIFGYILGRVGAWFSYSPVRQALRMQRKENRVLNKEQAKLNETVSGLKQDIVGLREKAQKAQAASDGKQNQKGWWKVFKGDKKGN